MQEGMFYRIRDYGYARNAKQAVGFYLFHLLVGLVAFVLAAAVCKLFLALPEGEEGVMMLVKVATAPSMLYVGYLSYRVLEAKSLLGKPKYWLFAALGLAVSMGGMLLGLIGVACFSILRPAVASGARDVAFNEKE